MIPRGDGKAVPWEAQKRFHNSLYGAPSAKFSNNASSHFMRASANFRVLSMSHLSISLLLSPSLRLCFLFFFFPRFPLIDHARVLQSLRGRTTTSTLPKINRNLFMYLLKCGSRVGSLREGFGRRQDLPPVPILRISKAIPRFISLSLSSSLQAPCRSSIVLSPCLPASSPPLRFRSRGNLQELLEMDRPAGWKPTPDFTRGIYANNRGNYVSVGARRGSSAHNQREK